MQAKKKIYRLYFTQNTKMVSCLEIKKKNGKSQNNNKQSFDYVQQC